MWSRTLAGVVAGALLSASVVINCNVLLPFATDSNLMFSLLAGFVMWVVVMIVCYTSNTVWHAWQRCSVAFIVSGSINALFLA
ncbi:MAG: hypothetical protein MJK04_01170 [Psychrosphaera sp.]|nr:hypothetical protein [Psychrosphaera sp.]